MIRRRSMDTGVTASFGVAEIDDDDTATNRVRWADDALYGARQEGRNTVRVAVRAEVHAR